MWLAFNLLRRYWAHIAVFILFLAWSAFMHNTGYERADQRAQYREALAAKAAQEQLLELANAHLEEEERLEALIAVMEANAYAALQEKNREIEKLRADVDAGAVRLRVKARCPASLPAASEPAPGAGVDTGGTAELDPSARPAYFALRSGIAKQETQLKACQGVLRVIVAP